MENKKAAMLVLAIAAAVIIATGGVYAMAGGAAPRTGSPYSNAGREYGMGSSMMGGYGGYRGGMMGGWNYPSMWQYMQQFMDHLWNSTSFP